jgi:hypothetical protein
VQVLPLPDEGLVAFAGEFFDDLADEAEVRVRVIAPNSRGKEEQLADGNSVRLTA